MKSRARHAFALEDALAVYGLRRNPFPIDEADDFFFSTPMLAKQIGVLRNLVEYGELLLVVSGVEGAGKTAILGQFLLDTPERWKCCRIDAREITTLEMLVKELLEGLGSSAGGENAQADEALLRAHLTNLQIYGSIPLVAVDDAHLLEPKCSEFLLELAEERDQFELRLLLGAEPGRLGFSINDAKRVHVVVLQPFDLQHSGEYIHARLTHAGLRGDSPFDATVIASIHQDAHGLPGTIHSQALHILLAKADISRPGRSPSKTTRPMIYAAAAIIAVAGAALLRPQAGIESAGHADAAAQPDAQAQPFSGRISPKARQADARAPLPGAVTPQTGGEAKVFALDDGHVATRPAIAVQSTSWAKSGLPDGGEARVRLAGNVSADAVASIESKADGNLDWLRKQNPSHYVIQLVGTRDARAAERFLADHHLGSKGVWFVTSHENKPWYVVVYGVYPDNASARAAIKALAEPLRAGSPWPRSVASLIESAH
jgi:DamX protein